MPTPNTQAPNPNGGWFSTLSRRNQALLLALLALAVSVGTLLMGLHDLRSGQPLTVMAGKSDWSDSFLFSAGSFVLAACLFAVALGWNPGRSGVRDTQDK